MSQKNRRAFQRKTNQRSYKKLFIIATEGQNTENAYFNLFKKPDASLQIKTITKNHKSSPPYILSRMKRTLKQEGLSSTDEAWLVLDKDHWTEDQLRDIHAWTKEAPNYNMALSNPNFEYWLLLHFEDGHKLTPSKNCNARLRQHVPNYKKNIEPSFFDISTIQSAINRAKKRNDPPCEDWPRKAGSTTVYLLVQRILDT